MIEAAEKVCERDDRWPEMVVLRGHCDRKAASL